jgi:carbamoyl-phosphate synthase small subunit
MPDAIARTWPTGARPAMAKTTGLLVLADGTVFPGIGLGAAGTALGEVCFNTAMSGYQEILTDPSYMRQIVTFTFPHIGNTGVNGEDLEGYQNSECGAVGAIFRDMPTAPSNWRATDDLDHWLHTRGIVGLAGIDTRALTAHVREHGMPHGVIAHSADGVFDIPALVEQAKGWSGLVGLDLAIAATSAQTFTADQGFWSPGAGYATPANSTHHVVLIDYGVKRNIARALVASGARVTVVPAKTTAEAILALKPDGVVLSNGPGDPAATGAYAVPEIKKLVASGTPIFGICLGHQMLAIALGCTTEKMTHGHHGANHPVKDLTTGKVEIVSMNHGFAVARASLPAGVVETHVSLFDGSNCGIALAGKPVFSVQHHPEASPGPQDSLYLFDRFMASMAHTQPKVMA